MCSAYTHKHTHESEKRMKVNEKMLKIGESKVIGILYTVLITFQ